MRVHSKEYKYTYRTKKFTILKFHLRPGQGLNSQLMEPTQLVVSDTALNNRTSRQHENFIFDINRP